MLSLLATQEYNGRPNNWDYFTWKHMYEDGIREPRFPVPALTVVAGPLDIVLLTLRFN